MGKSLIEFSHVCIDYADYQVLSNVSFKIDIGKLYVLTGENGAGKSTLLKVIMGMKTPTKGSVTRKFKQFGFLPEKVDLPSYVKASEFLEDMISLKNTKTSYRVKNELEYFKLKNVRYNSMSKGMKQKLAIIQSYIADQELVILDEPLNGLDLDSKELLVNKISELNDNGKTVIVVTHFYEIFAKLHPIIIKLHDKSVTYEF